MNGLEPHRYFQRHAELIAEPRRRLGHQARMTLDYHAFKSTHAISDGLVVRRWDRPRVKETAAVVEFDGACAWELRDRMIDLCRDSADRRWPGERMLPKVAHEA